MDPRYLRQTVLKEIGSEGQQQLARARVLVVGAGGLGSPVLLYLAAAGVGLRAAGGRIGLIDDDRVDTSNLQRQVVFRESDEGEPKALAAARHLVELNGEVDLQPLMQRLSPANVVDIFSGYDIVVDGTDNFAAKYLINDAAVKLGLPVVYGSILGFEGQVSVFWARHGPCYRCLYPRPPTDQVANCAEAGTLGGVAGMIGTIQAVEVCKLALGLDHCRAQGLETLLGRLWVIDARNWESLNLRIAKSPDCPVCSLPPAELALPGAEATYCASAPPTRLTLADLAALRARGERIVLLDVREPQEWEEKRLAGAHLLPLASLFSEPDQLESLDANAKILVYCEHGIRSAGASRYLREQGYDAYNLVVDWAQWEREQG
ncbi:HesA/MoeB/ThiF family protein [Rhodocyclus purpureus]|uniref:HesA/MoeB/ThiF family protein n=1 Tax=Rhodocyclus purpureus TaxID=1067 RepID=UPI0019138248|nr:HesA/MoeB/ThiF family protein [Rhodocyclus purpureus]MBK5913646.1 hypothetical protein [Rhodocyclus purpureus]